MWVCRTVACAWDLNANGRPAVGDTDVGDVDVLGAVLVEATDFKDRGELCGRGVSRDPD